jgi:hypothetical protein
VRTAETGRWLHFQQVLGRQVFRSVKLIRHAQGVAHERAVDSAAEAIRF